MKEIHLVDSPEVTIVIPMYNAEKYIGQTLDSLNRQTFVNFEIILVDDGSTDSSMRIVNQFSFDRRLRVIHKENGGTGSALNIGHAEARGKYVTWCSADNIYLPNYIEILYRALNAGVQQGIELVYSDFCFINEQGQRIRDVLHDKPQSLEDLVEGYDVGMSFMYTKALWDKTGHYWNRICEDFDWTVRAAQHTKFGLVKAVLAGFRVHGAQLTGSNKIKEAEAANDCKQLAKQILAQSTSLNPV